MNQYYVYIYLREDGSPYYVGKGKKNRWRARNHSVDVPQAEKVIFPITNTTEEWAHFVEMELIDLHGRLNDGTGILENLTDGGEGQSGFIHSNKSKQKISQSKRGTCYGPMSTEHKMKIGIAKSGVNHHYYGKKHCAEYKAKMSEVKRNAMTNKLRQQLGSNTRNTIWITDGDITKRILMTSDIPDGFVRGRIYPLSTRGGK